MQLKAGGRIPEKGKKISLTVRDINDLSRDVIKVCFCCDLNLNFVLLYMQHKEYAFITLRF
jgi:hypothetical protein